LHGGLVVSWPVTAALTVESLTGHWRQVGLPGSAQLDNDMIFHGTHRYAAAILRWSYWRRERNPRAAASHHKQQLAGQGPPPNKR